MLGPHARCHLRLPESGGDSATRFGQSSAAEEMGVSWPASGLHNEGPDPERGVCIIVCVNEWVDEWCVS